MSSPFIKKVYDISVSRIKNGLELDLNDFSQVLTAQEIGRLSGIIARTPKEKDKDPTAEFKDCVKVIRDEFEKKSIKQTDLSDNESFLKLFGKSDNK